MAGFSIGLGSEKSKQSGTSTTASNRTLEELLSTISNSLNQQTEDVRTAEQVRQQSLSEATLQSLRQQIATVGGLATAEAQTALRDAAVKRALDSGMADVISLGSNSGAYDSTVQGQAGQQLAVRAGIEGQQVQTDAMLGFLSQLQGLFGVEKGAVTESSSFIQQLAELLGSQSTTESSRRSATESGTSTTKSKGKTSGSQMSFGGSGSPF